MDLDKALFISVILFLLISYSALFYFAYLKIDMAEKQGPIELNNGNLDQWKGAYIKTYLTPEKRVTEKTELKYVIFMPVTSGKSTILIPIPIFDHYYIYDTYEGIYLAKKTPILIGEKILIYGTLNVDDNGKYIFIEGDI